jgi:hypothetical protein
MIWAVVAAAALVRAAHAAPQVPTDPRLPAALARFRGTRHVVNPMQHRGVAPPAILSGSIVTPTVSVTTGAASPTFRFKFNAPGYYYENQVGFTGPSGQSIGFGYFIAPPGAEKTGTITFDGAGQPLSVYTQPGVWKLTYAEITDLAGNKTVYDTDDQLDALFPSRTLNIVNQGRFDITPPVVSSGKILTPTVSLSSANPFLGVALTATDDLSGIYFVVIYLNEPGGTAYSGSDVLEAPTQMLAGTIMGGALLTPGLPTGTWTITGYEVCDYTNNCLTQTNPSTLQQQLGTTSFTVTP